MNIYPMLSADSRFWWVNDREIYTRIWRLTSLAWDKEREARHWWRHHGDSDRRPLSLPLRCDRVTLCLYNYLGLFNGIAGMLKLWKRFKCNKHRLNMGHIRFSLFASANTGICQHLASRYHAWHSAARGIAMLRVDEFPYPRKQAWGN